jgi:CRISPR-associated protein Csd1
MASLNAMLERDSGHSFTAGDTTYVYWSDRRGSKKADTPFDASAILTKQFSLTENSAEVDARLDAIFDGIRSGRADPVLNPASLDPVCILGLSGNAARIVVRSWMMIPPKDLFARVTRHADDCRIENRTKAPKPWGMLLSSSIMREKGNIDRLPPDLGRSITEAILRGTPYPRALLPLMLRRLRAERDDPRAGYSVISPDRISILRALLQRMPTKEKIPMTLDTSHTDTGYQLGRLFALIELAQTKAVPGARATVRDRMMSAASTTPRSVFPNLMRRLNPHLAKLRRAEQTRGFSIWLNRQIAETFESISGGIPRTLNLEEQARFFAGYYQQAHGSRPARSDDPAADAIDTQSDITTEKDQDQ